MKPPSIPPSPRRPWRELLPLLIPVLAAILGFAGTVPGDYVFDDAVIVQGDPALQSFDLHRIFRENYWGRTRTSPNWRPLTLLTYALNFQVSDGPGAFHAVNVLLNAAVAVAFYLVARELLLDRWLAAGAAALYAVLPIHVEAVANIVGRAELLAALAIFLAWWLALRRGGQEGPGTALAVASVVLLGLLSKENAAVVLALIPVSVYLLRRRIPWWSTSAALAMVVLYLVLEGLFLQSAPAGPGGAALIDNPLAQETAPARVLNAIRLLGVYAWRTVLPIHLAADHSYDQLPVLPLSSPELWLGAAGVSLAIAAPLALWWRRSPALAVAFAAFPVGFAATANVFFPLGTIFAERLAFVPSAFYPLALAAGLGGRAAPSRERRLAAALVLGALTLVYGGRSWARNGVWEDVATFDIRLAQDSPRSTRAHGKAAEGYILLSRRTDRPAEKARFIEKAEAEVAEALRIAPWNSSARAFRALVILESGRPEEALRALEDAEAAYVRERVERDPQLDMLRGEALYKVGRPEEAQAALDLYLERRGPMPRALNLRGVCRMQRGLLDGAAADFAQAIAIEPRYADARMKLGIALAQLGRREDARRELDEAARLAPEDPQVYTNRGFLRYQSGDAAGAVADYRAGQQVAEKKGLPEGSSESALAFRGRIFEALLGSGDLEGARKELEAIRALGSPHALAAARDLEARLGAKTGPP